MRATHNLKIWFILLNNQEEGPYSINDLRSDRRITPYTLVRKMASKKWEAIGKVKELRAVFRDDERPPEKDRPSKPLVPSGGEAALWAPPSDPDGPVTLLVFIVLLLVVWIIYNILT